MSDFASAALPCPALPHCASTACGSLCDSCSRKRASGTSRRSLCWSTPLASCAGSAFRRRSVRCHCDVILGLLVCFPGSRRNFMTVYVLSLFHLIAQDMVWGPHRRTATVLCPPFALLLTLLAVQGYSFIYIYIYLSHTSLLICNSLCERSSIFF